MDVTNYADLLHLFDTAMKKFGRVDIAISKAGIIEVGNWMDLKLDLETVKQVCSM